MANKKQQIILTHGSAIPSGDVLTNMALGEVLVQHAETAKDTALHTKNSGGNLVSFPSKDYVTDYVTGITDTINQTIEGHNTDIQGLKSAVGDASSGLIHDVSANTEAIVELKDKLGLNEEATGDTLASRVTNLEETVGDENSGLVKDVADNAKAIEVEAQQRAKDDEALSGSVNTINLILTGYSSGNTVQKAIADQKDYTDRQVETLNNTITAITASYDGQIEGLTNADNAIDARLDVLENPNYAGTSAIQNAIKAATTEVVSGSNLVTVNQTTGETNGNKIYSISVSGLVETGAFEGLETKVNKLIDNDSNKSVRTIANEELAKQLIPSGASESLDTLQEIAAWIQEHPNDASQMNENILELQKTVSGFTSSKTVSGETSSLRTITEDLGNSKLDKEDFNTYSAATNNTLVELDNKITAETQTREAAITGLTAQITGLTDTIGLLEEAVDTIQDNYITTIDVINDNDKISVSKSGTTVTLDFSNMIIDGGEY